MSSPLTQLQLMILTVLWEMGETTVLDLHDALRKERRVSQATIATLLSRMEERGFVTHGEDRRPYLYRATATPEQVRRSVVSDFSELTSRLFAGDVAGLVSQLLSVRDVNPDDLVRAREIIQAKERALRTKENET